MYCIGSFKCYVTQMGVGGVTFSGKKRYEGVRFNVISITRGWVGVQFPGTKRYVTLEWPLCTLVCIINVLYLERVDVYSGAGKTSWRSHYFSNTVSLLLRTWIA